MVNAVKNDVDLYSGTTGRSYYDQRAEMRSASTQRRRATVFADIAGPDLSIVDFGCGNGGVLAALPAKRRIGIEIGPEAAAEASRVLDVVHPSLARVPDQSVDVVISNHALEHVSDPYQAVTETRRVLVDGGRFRLIVPLEGAHGTKAHAKWEAGDPTMHVFSWTPQTFGNLLSMAGLEVESVRVIPSSISERFPFLKEIKSLVTRRYQIMASGYRAA